MQDEPTPTELIKAVADFLQSLIDQLTGEVDVNVVLEVHRHVRQAEQAYRTDFLHLRQTRECRLDWRREQLLDILGRETGRFGVDVDLHRRDVGEGIDRYVADRVEAEEGHHRKHDQD